MSISSTERAAGPYTGNGVAVAFPFGFKVFQAADVLVSFTSVAGIEVALTLDSDYTVALNDDQDAAPGGVVTLGTPLAVGELLTLTSQVPATQPVVLANLGAFLPDVINGALDRLTILVQQAMGSFSRGLQFPVSETGSNPTLPSVAARAGKFLAFDALGRPSVGVPVADSSADVRLDLAALTGAATVGVDDGVSGARFTDVQGAVNDFLSGVTGVAVNVTAYPLSLIHI